MLWHYVIQVPREHTLLLPRDSACAGADADADADEANADGRATDEGQRRHGTRRAEEDGEEDGEGLEVASIVADVAAVKAALRSRRMAAGRRLSQGKAARDDGSWEGASHVPDAKGKAAKAAKDEYERSRMPASVCAVVAPRLLRRATAVR